MTNIFTHCITCNSKKIKKVRGALPVVSKGKALKIPNIEYYKCAECGEKFTDLDNESKIDAYLKSDNLVASKS